MVKVIQIPIYRQSFTLFVPENKDDLQFLCDKYRIDTFDGLAKVESHIIDGSLSIALIFKNIKEAQDNSIVAHECFHIVCLLTRHLGIRLCHKSEESFAYLLSFIMEEVNKNVAKMVKEREKAKIITA